METVTVDVWVLVDETGDYVASDDATELGNRWEEKIAEFDPTTSKRQVKVTLTIPLPRPVELVATVPAEVETGAIRVA